MTTQDIARSEAAEAAMKATDAADQGQIERASAWAQVSLAWSAVAATAPIKTGLVTKPRGHQ